MAKKQHTSQPNDTSVQLRGAWVCALRRTSWRTSPSDQEHVSEVHCYILKELSVSILACWLLTFSQTVGLRPSLLALPWETDLWWQPSKTDTVYFCLYQLMSVPCLCWSVIFTPPLLVEYHYLSLCLLNRAPPPFFFSPRRHPPPFPSLSVPLFFSPGPAPPFPLF